MTSTLTLPTEAAFATGMSETTIRRWAKSGRIQARRIGGRVFVAK